MLDAVVILVYEVGAARPSERTAPKVECAPLGRQPLVQPLGGRRCHSQAVWRESMTLIVPAIRSDVLQLLAILGPILFGSIVPGDGWSQTRDSQASPPRGETKANPFAGFETHHLSNGLRVWFKRLPNAPEVSISVGVPYGWDSDPEGQNSPNWPLT